jgi:hypothetical protein
MTRINLIASLVAVLFTVSVSFAQVDMSALNLPLTQDFDTLASTGTNNVWSNNTTIPGWYSSRVAYNAGTGSSNTGALYSFGVAGANPVTDRALGGIASGGTGTFFWGVRLRNSTGSQITSLAISLTGEQWRDGGATVPVAHLMTFDYLTSATPITDISAGTYTAAPTLDFSSPTFTNTGAGALLDGNLTANRTAISSTLNVTLNPGDEIMLRWTDINNAGNDHGLAIDNFSVTPAGASVAFASLGGRITTAGGIGIRGSIVTVEGGGLPSTLYATTGTFGYYNFSGLATGQTYTVTVNARRYTFSPSSQVVGLSSDLSNVNFAANP